MRQQGVILAGGTGTRLGELTKVTNKHLLPVGEYPMIYHPIKKLVGAGITDIMLISGTEHMGDFIELLGSGSNLNCCITYRVQDIPGGIAQALLLTELHEPNVQSVVLLGDNIFYDSLRFFIDFGRQAISKAIIALAEVQDPQRYGVAELDHKSHKIVSIEEKPNRPRGKHAVTGMYIYPPDVFDVIRRCKPSSRGEYEITDVNNYYLASNRIDYSIIRGYWTDAGTHISLGTANHLVRANPPLY